MAYTSNFSAWDVRSLNGGGSSAYSSNATAASSVAGAAGTANQISSIGSMFGSSSGSSGFGGFMGGFQAGYQGAVMTLTPWLAYKQAKNERRIMQAKEDTANLAASVYTDAAEQVLRQSDNQYAQYSYAAGQKKSAQKVAFAANGVRVGVGSSAEYLASHDIATQMNLNTIHANGIANAFGYRMSATNARAEALSYAYAKKSISPMASAIAAGFKAVSDAGDVTKKIKGLLGNSDSGSAASGAGGGGSQAVVDGMNADMSQAGVSDYNSFWVE